MVDVRNHPALQAMGSLELFIHGGLAKRGENEADWLVSELSSLPMLNITSCLTPGADTASSLNVDTNLRVKASSRCVLVWEHTGIRIVIQILITDVMCYSYVYHPMERLPVAYF